MKIKIKEFRETIKEVSKELYEYSVSNVKIKIKDDGTKSIINQEDGKVLAKDISNWVYKNFVKLFKDFGIDFIEVETEGMKKRKDDFLSDGQYSKRKFLNKILEKGKKYHALNQDEIIPIVKGKPLAVNTLSTQRHVPENFYKNIFEKILEEGYNYRPPPIGKIKKKTTEK